MAEENVNAFGLPDALAKRLAEITPDKLIPPEDDRPEGVESLGTVPEDLRPLWTLATLLSNEYVHDVNDVDEMRHCVVAGLNLADITGALLLTFDALANDNDFMLKVSRAALIEMDLPQKQEDVNRVLDALDAEFERRFPIFTEKNVKCYKDWSFSVLSDEDAAAISCWVCGDSGPLSM